MDRIDVMDVLRDNLGIEKLLQELQEIKTAVTGQSSRSVQEWYNLKDACRRKGVCYNTVKSNRSLQPKGGLADATVGGRRVWHRTTVESWLREVDKEGVRS